MKPGVRTPLILSSLQDITHRRHLQLTRQTWYNAVPSLNLMSSNRLFTSLCSTTIATVKGYYLSVECNLCTFLSTPGRWP